ncbi:VOC family protein [Burkholderia sp. Ax-1719]|uniref:VOC family protein n=1 Tax=Burkholderia sp. Ax-1719 TaxID=2608334 RepID=UPI00142015A7|nr:VOC family protein [Burkholderia sp. Ax-1719]NIE62785.1 VOC family protein [Burkholderia sp. Ax-1719]
MSLPLDHVVIRVADLEQAIADFSETGFTVQRGGIHADGATHHALIGFDDGRFLDLAAALPGLRHARESRLPRGVTSLAEGFSDFALLSTTITDSIDAARTRGLHYEGPIPGGRIRPDGTRIEWQTADPATRDLPLLCSDLTPRFLRVAVGDARRHANGALGIASVAIVVRDLEASIKRYRALLGGEFDAHVVALPSHAVRLATFASGTATLVLLAPRGAPEQDDDDTLAADLRAFLAASGEGVFGVTLATAHPSHARKLSRALTHGASLELVA